MSMPWQRVIIHQPGGYQALELATDSDSAPNPQEVVIRVAAAGVNYADCVIRMGLYKSAKELHGYPITPGFEVAGTVTHVGDQVTDFKVGDEAIGITLFGGYCQQICLPQTQVFKKPASLSMAEAAGLPTVYLTAWFALHHLAHIEKGQQVLVHSGAGGVGLAALQLAKRAGAKATAVVGASHKCEIAEQYGADSVIDKSTQPLWPAAEKIAANGFHTILDPNGYSTLQQSYEHLAAIGKLVVYGFHSMLPKSSDGSVGKPNYLALVRDRLRTPRFNPLDMTAANKSVLAFNLSFLTTETNLMRRAMNDILSGIASGELRPLPVELIPLEQVADAQRRLESGQTTGKLILDCQ